VKLHQEFQVGFTGACGDAGISASKVSFGNLQIWNGLTFGLVLGLNDLRSLRSANPTLAPRWFGLRPVRAASLALGGDD
jgi:hypothetical protein